MKSMMLGWKGVASWVVLLVVLGLGIEAASAGEEGARKEQQQQQQQTYRLSAEDARAALLALMDTLPDTDPFTWLRDSVKKAKGETDPDHPGIVGFGTVVCDLAAETFWGQVGPWPLQWWEFRGKFEKTPAGSWKAMLVWEVKVQT